MSTKRLLVGAALVSAVSALFSGAAAADGASLDCAAVTAYASYRGSGYSHLVTLINHCQSAVTCEVWTNVDPSPHVTLHAKPGETVETITRIGSPSSDVQAGKQCRLGN
ncbi:MAG TPA: hypothetical protein VGF76_18260 [Polyangiaceae bacterium]|jgi:hypothetical protein